LLQDRGSACIMAASGGEYKCWKGYTGASVAPDGKWAVALGSRNAKSEPEPKSKKDSKKNAKKKDAKQKDADKNPAPDDEPTNEDENATEMTATDDVEVAPPTGPLALYRTKLAGPFSEAPARIVSVVDGAAVWVPGPTR
jgi:hypothetical protein